MRQRWLLHMLNTLGNWTNYVPKIYIGFFLYFAIYVILLYPNISTVIELDVMNHVHHHFLLLHISIAFSLDHRLINLERTISS